MAEIVKVANVGDNDIHIHNAIVIPKGATNGDMVMAMFSVEIIDDFCRSFGVRLNDSNYIQFNKDWWYAPYTAGREE